MKQLLLLTTLSISTILHAQLPLQVADIRPGAMGCAPHSMATFQGKLYFTATDSTKGSEKFAYDGTTAKVAFDLNVGSGHGAPSVVPSVVFNSKLYFPGTNGSTGVELYSYDGVSAPALVADIEPGMNQSGPSNLTVLGSKLYFKAGTIANGPELYSYDGTNPPVLEELTSGQWASSPQYITAYNSKLYFAAHTLIGGYTVTPIQVLCTYDPATGYYGIVQGIDSVVVPKDLYVANGKLYFSSIKSSSGKELYSYDGTNLTKLTNLNPPGQTAGATGPFIAFNNKLYFAYGELYAYDFASGNTGKLLNSGGGDVVMPLVTELAYAVYAGKMYFAAKDAANGTEIWVTDGTSANTKLLVDLNPGTPSSNPGYFCLYNNRLYFSATTAASGRELFRISDPAGVENIQLKSSVKAYPNPARESVTIECSLQQPYALAFYLTDLSGSVIWKKDLGNYSVGKSVVQLSFSHLPAGTYFYHVENASHEKLAAGSLVKQ